LAFPHTGQRGPVLDDLLDVDDFLAHLDDRGITSAVVSPWLDIAGYELPADEGAAWARFLNEQMLELIRDEPRLAAMATVPLQDGALAAQEVEAALEMGFAGVEIGTSVGDVELDDPSLLTFWQSLDEHARPVFLHPMFRRSEKRMYDDFAFGLANSVGRIVDTTIAVSRLLFSGTLASVPNVKLLVAHGGASIPYIAGRLRRTFQIAPEKMADPNPGFRNLFFDTVLFDVTALEFLVRFAGHDRVLMGSDHPFPNRDPDPRRVVVDALQDEEKRAAVLGKNAQEVFKI
jgi:aminocarboxymuconate-semialdehyde decarboxylase